MLGTCLRKYVGTFDCRWETIFRVLYRTIDGIKHMQGQQNRMLRSILILKQLLVYLVLWKSTVQSLRRCWEHVWGNSMIELLTVDGKLFSASCIVQSTASNTCRDSRIGCSAQFWSCNSSWIIWHSDNQLYSHCVDVGNMFEEICWNFWL